MAVYLISKLADPLFAVTIGIAASASRIRRDQIEKNPEKASEIGYATIVQLGQHRLQRWWNGDFQGL
ncbi:hypothetical protein N7468_009792 [Penicillium chermesinum]|uniref:Non-classical export protein 1 n=1 Tax=Penicillium chermesinum TaxID=63820 RepID=A0A9W9TBX1_9EURO|nr:uncharacterized protein N7468_009792 [Penicillium chermesinum]KAJ5216784.1 hypothetical protein N7468_009792 [Penicillium chermesinum]KAJ6171597.1 hypothetical protein N7470_000664 [Penicillium chermesinum]